MAIRDAPKDVPEPVESARSRLVAMRGAPTGEWRELIAGHLAHAYATGDVDALATTVQFMCYLLDAEGRFDDALEEVRHALRLAEEPSPARAFLLVMEATILSALGEHTGAVRAVDASQGVLGQLGDAASPKSQILTESVRLQLFLEPSDRLGDLVRSSAGPAATADHLFLLSWYVPWLAARGRTHEAAPLIRQLQAQAAAGENRWRQADASVFQTWKQIIAGNVAEPDPIRSPNALGSWRNACLRLWHTCSRHAVLDTQDRIAALVRARRKLGTADVGPPEVWEALHSALTGGGAATGGGPPRTLSLANLPAGLAAAQAIAVAGSVTDARIWLRWVVQVGRAGVQSSLEWPVSRLRLQALLTLRAGRLAESRRLMSEAIEWAAREGYVVEGAVSRLQLGELSALNSFGESWRASVEAARLELIALGVDPLPHVEAIHSGQLVRMGKPSTVLTGREIEVLRVLATGATYAAAAEALSVARPTVQSFAHRIYEKLGVSGRHKAVVRARDLGIL